MMDDNKATSTDNHQKKITITQIRGKHWDVDFVGQITRRDIQKLHRVLSVEYAKVQRRRSTIKILARDNIELKKQEVETVKTATIAKTETETETETSTPKLPSKPKPKDITNG